MKTILTVILLVGSMVAQTAKPVVKPKPKQATRTVVLTATVTGHSATLNWSNPAVPPTVTGNNVYQGLSATGPWTKVVASSVPIVTVVISSGLVANTQYFFYTTATCVSCNPQESNPSNIANGTTGPDPQPNPPTGLTVTTIN